MTLEPAKGGKPETLECDVVLVAVGRVPNTEGLGLAEAGINTDNRGRIVVDEKFATNVPGIYAIGDVIRGPMLAHKAEEEGVALAEISGGPGRARRLRHNSERDLYRARGRLRRQDRGGAERGRHRLQSRESSPSPPTAAPRSTARPKASSRFSPTRRRDRVLGVHIIGADAGTMIAEAAVLMAFGGSAEDLARICHAHPTLNEAVKEAALAVDKRPIHM